MLLYKFRSLDPFDRTADILCNNRLHAAPFYDLNDPMEGLFDSDPETKREYLEQVREGKQRLRITALSKNFSNLLLWAHYADGFKGICIELDVQESPAFQVQEVVYSPFSVIFGNSDHHQIDHVVRSILRTKNEVWEYEEEMRILSERQFIDTGIKVKKVLLGVRTPTLFKGVIWRLAQGRFPVYETRISRHTNSIERGARLQSLPVSAADESG